MEKEITSKLVSAEEIEKHLPQFPCFGELGYHRELNIDLSKVSHVVKSAKMIDGKLIAEIELIKSPYQPDIERLLPNLRLVPRMLGTIEDGKYTNLKIITFDLICND